MPSIPKKTSLLKSVGKIFNTVAPKKSKKAQAVLNYAKKITPNMLINYEPKAQSLIKRVKRSATVKKLRIMESNGKINLNQPIYKLFKKK